MALYMVHARLEDDEQAREWFIDMSADEATILEGRLDTISLREGYSPLYEYGVVLVEDEGPSALSDFLEDLEADFAPTVLTRD